MALNPYTIDSLININTGCFVCEDEAMQETHGLCCDLVHTSRLDFRKILSLYSQRYDTGKQKELEQIVIKNVVRSLYRRNVDDVNPTSLYKFCQLSELDFQIIAKLSCVDLISKTSSFHVSEGEAGEREMNARAHAEKEITDPNPTTMVSLRIPRPRCVLAHCCAEQD